jgi:hypothetical protein
MPPVQRYLWTWLGSTAAFMALVAVINLVVDPYGLFRIVDVPGLNRIKSQAGERAKLFKRAGLARMQPASLILGNSRAEIGFDPASPAWPERARPVFNLALPGAGIEAVAAEFDAALRGVAPGLVVVGLDFLDFRVDPTADETYTAPAEDSEPLRSLRDYAGALLTLGTLADSLTTLKAQHDPYASRLTDAGFNPKHDYVGIARREGYYAMFRQRDQENARAYVRGPKSVFQTGSRAAPGFAAVEDIIARARARGIALRFVLYPYHSHTLVLFELTGLWPAYEAWKRELVRQVDAARSTMDVELWDFTGFSPYTGERVPRPGDTRTELRWYWEAGHFKQALGDLLLSDIFSGKDPGPQLGRRLTGSNLDESLRQQRVARNEYMHEQIGDTAVLEALVAESLRR